jgi:type VI secretion system secreted protein VgrG
MLPRKAAARTADAPEETATARTASAFEDWKKGIPKPGLVDPVADVAYLTKDVPGLEGDLAALRAKGWKVEYGEPGKGSWCNAEKVPPEIVVDPEGEPTDLLKTLAHEVGHANERPTPVRDAAALSRDDYVATRLNDMALSEGQAVLNEVTSLQALRRAVLARTGESPSLPYQGMYRTIAENKALSFDQKVEKIGLRYMQEEIPSVGSGEQNYNGYWTDLFAHEWDVAHGIKPAE